MKRYKSREVVEAVQLSASNRQEVAAWSDGWFYDSNGDSELYVSTVRGGERAREGDWIVKRESGFSVMSEDEFQSAYEDELPR